MFGWGDDEKQYERDRKAEAQYGSRCPHEHIEFCPLYVAGHSTRVDVLSFGCVDDMARPCRVKRGKIDYAKSEAELAATAPRLVANCKFSEEARVSKEQRERNMRSNGIH